MDLKKYKIVQKGSLRKASLCFLTEKDRVLLAMKKRGFGKGRYNGVGGKPDKDESIKQAAIRETQEEINVTPIILNKKAILDFYFPHNPDWNQQVHVFLIEEWKGEPEESEEMTPKWFNKRSIPYKKMWSDDHLWFPKVLRGQLVKATFIFKEGDEVLDFELKTPRSL